MTNVFTEAVDKVKSYDPDLFLGRLVWYTVTEDVNVDHGEFCKLMLSEYEGTGVKPRLPNAPRQRDVFKRACSHAEEKKVPTDQAGIYLNYMVRPAGTDADNVYRNVVREQVDSSGHKLDYTEFIRVNYNAVADQVSFDERVPFGTDTTMLESIKQSIRSYFNQWSHRLTAYTVRELVRRNLERNMYAIRVRPSGGIYFVSEEYSEQLDALERVINSLENGTTLHTLPLLDDGKQREMLRAAFEDESVGECDKLIGEMTEILKSDKKITKDRFVQFKVEYDAMRKKVVDYSDLLDEKLDHTSTSLAIVKKTMTKLMGNIKAE